MLKYNIFNRGYEMLRIPHYLGNFIIDGSKVTPQNSVDKCTAGHSVDSELISVAV
jgi:hypothetical protein